ncbi:hypothetical protein TPA0910_72920 [Streptomyces hygroscopicus subsp. sporocinereus]|uniref:Uncharacterized protein n=1 Tax=Streptomyces hygroscopicus TaxID=1912 RepID=A0ABQ3UBA0_STRHY|nr:hypothetical protein TPA0910_72920 [Streptomyces hygroscopicus]
MVAAEPVMCSTSRFCTVSCIQVPTLDTRFAADHHRMARWRRLRHGVRVPRSGERGLGMRGGREKEVIARSRRCFRYGATGRAPSGARPSGGAVPRVSNAPCSQTTPEYRESSRGGFPHIPDMTCSGR